MVHLTDEVITQRDKDSTYKHQRQVRLQSVKGGHWIREFRQRRLKDLRHLVHELFQVHSLQNLEFMKIHTDSKVFVFQTSFHFGQHHSRVLEIPTILLNRR